MLLRTLIGLIFVASLVGCDEKTVDPDPDYNKVKVRIIAHRGYWKEEHEQNTIYSLLEAEKIKVYGSEFDVSFTSDSILIVAHGPFINKLKISQTTFERLKKEYPNLVTLSTFLDAAKKTNHIRLFLDLKAHESDEMNKIIPKLCVELLKEKNLLPRTVFLTPNTTAGNELVRILPDSAVYSYATTNLAMLKQVGYKGLSTHYQTAINNPNLALDTKKSGLGFNVWTVNEANLLQEFIEDSFKNNLDALITTDYPVRAQKIAIDVYKKYAQ